MTKPKRNVFKRNTMKLRESDTLKVKERRFSTQIIKGIEKGVKME